MWERLSVFDAPLCASENCNRLGVASAWRLDAGGVGSCYCDDCKISISAVEVGAPLDLSNKRRPIYRS